MFKIIQLGIGILLVYLSAVMQRNNYPVLAVADLILGIVNLSFAIWL